VVLGRARGPLRRRIVVGIAVAHHTRFLAEPRRRTDAAAGRFGNSMNATVSAIASSRYFAATVLSKTAGD
jgi:hypothetical protein